MNCYVYILECNGGMYYTGITWNIKKRISEHNNDINTPIQVSRRPVKVVYLEKFETRIFAARREKEIKGWSRKKKEQLIRVYVEEQSDETGSSSVG